METTTTTHISSLVTRHLDEIRRIAEDFGVERLEVYGDAAEGELESPTAPIHFLVTYPEDYDLGPYLSRYIQMIDELTEVIGRYIHLTMSEAATYYPHREAWINETRQPIYAAT